MNFEIVYVFGTLRSCCSVEKERQKGCYLLGLKEYAGDVSVTRVYNFIAKNRETTKREFREKPSLTVYIVGVATMFTLKI